MQPQQQQQRQQEEWNALLCAVSHSNVPWPQFQAGPGARCQFWAETWAANVFGGRSADSAKVEQSRAVVDREVERHAEGVVSIKATFNCMRHIKKNKRKYHAYAKWQCDSLLAFFGCFFAALLDNYQI